MDEWVNDPTKSEGFPGAQRVKSMPTMRETQVQSLGWEDPLEKEMATHSGSRKIFPQKQASKQKK